MTSAQLGLDLDSLDRLYRTMSLIRHFETAAGRLLATGELAGFLHLSIGQEAIAAGVCDVLDDTDYLTTTHRGHGHCIAKGGRVDAMFAEIMARATGYCGGRSGSMHVADPRVGILGANAIVGASVPIALGAALAAQIRGERRVAVAFFGDGAAAEGTFHESMNLAALWRLPVVLVCEHNNYAEMTPTSVHLNNTTIADYAAPHRIPAETVDGNDVLAVRDAAHRAVTRARDGGGPTLLECRTYRVRGHFEGDPARYRPPGEADLWNQRDPLLVLRQHLADRSYDDSRCDKIDHQCGIDIDAAIDWARTQPPPAVTGLTDHVYRVPTAHEEDNR